MNTKNAVMGGGAGTVLLLLLAWWLGWFHREDEFVAEIRELATAPQSDENRDAMRDAMRERFQGVPEDQRMQVFEQLAPVFIPMMMARFETEYDKFMAMTPEERNRELDRRINEMAARDRPGGPGGGPGGFGGQRGARPNMDPKKMDEFRKKMLGWTTPEQRSKMQNGMQMFAERMRQRGMEPPPMPGGGFF
jgi:hypothetical protein